MKEREVFHVIALVGAGLSLLICTIAANQENWPKALFFLAFAWYVAWSDVEARR